MQNARRKKWTKSVNRSINKLPTSVLIPVQRHWHVICFAPPVRSIKTNTTLYFFSAPLKTPRFISLA